jgi:class 3 adenylate cyclase
VSGQGADRCRVVLAQQAAIEVRGTTDGERKTITALLADLKGSMALMEDLDPEEARSIIDPVLALMMEAVHRYEGYVAQSTGDGIFAFFGAPITCRRSITRTGATRVTTICKWILECGAQRVRRISVPGPWGTSSHSLPARTNV